MSPAEARDQGRVELVRFVARKLALAVCLDARGVGASVRAADWVKEADVPARGWHSARRRRSNSNNAFVPKTRWLRTLQPRPKAPAMPPRAEPAALPDWTRIGDINPGPPLGVPFG